MRDRLLHRPLQRARILRYRALSTCERVQGSATLWQPALFLGAGEIIIGRDVELGWPTSAGFHAGYVHLEASRPESRIELGDGVQLNNNAVLKSEGPGIRIGAGGLLGSDVVIFDSDFHDLRPQLRRGGTPHTGAVELEDNVFVGERAMILKGVRIGADSVIGAGSVVVSSIPAGVVAAGNPARIVREL